MDGDYSSIDLYLVHFWLAGPGLIFGIDFYNHRVIGLKERPILFNGEMVRAILEGRKTMTRRPMKPQPVGFDPAGYCDPYNKNFDHFTFWTADDKMQNGLRGNVKGTCHWRCPYGQPGDRLWVRETFCLESNYEYTGENLPTDGRPIKSYLEGGDSEYQEWPHYRATEPDVEIVEEDQDLDDFKGTRWKPSIHMHRWASRITLEITNVRVERIQEMGMEDVRREGYGPDFDTLDFSQSWNTIYPKSWDRNDWVWVIEFKRIVP